MTAVLKFVVAILYDLLDASNIIPGLGDLVEAILGGSVAYILTGNPKATAASAVDGILPPPRWSLQMSWGGWID